MECVHPASTRGREELNDQRAAGHRGARQAGGASGGCPGLSDARNCRRRRTRSRPGHLPGRGLVAAPGFRCPSTPGLFQGAQGPCRPEKPSQRVPKRKPGGKVPPWRSTPQIKGCLVMTFTELFAAAFGLVGALLLATRSRHSGLGSSPSWPATSVGWRLPWSVPIGRWSCSRSASPSPACSGSGCGSPGRCGPNGATNAGTVSASAISRPEPKPGARPARWTRGGGNGQS